MGRDKARLPFGPGEVMLERVVRLVAEAVPPQYIVCVAAGRQQLPPLSMPVQVVRDSLPGSGPLGGLVSGILAIRSITDVAFVCGCDMPLVEPAFAAQMFEELGEHQIAVPDDGEHLHPLAAVYRTDVLPLGDVLLEAGKRSLLALVAACNSFRVSTDSLRDVDPDLLSLTACNSPEEYQWALRTAGLSRTPGSLA